MGNFDDHLICRFMYKMLKNLFVNIINFEDQLSFNFLFCVTKNISF